MHTLAASDAFKKAILNKYPKLKRFYRAIYSLGSVLFLGLWYVYLPPATITFYSIDTPYIWFFWAMQGIGVFGLAHAVLISYPLIFIGLKQLILHPDYEFHLDEPKQATQLRIKSVYRFVRHPMYFWSIVYLVMNPIMTDRHAFLTLLFIAYFYWGSFPEERKLISRFGDDYRDYQKRIPRLIPGLKKVQRAWHLMFSKKT